MPQNVPKYLDVTHIFLTFINFNINFKVYKTVQVCDNFYISPLTVRLRASS